MEASRSARWFVRARTARNVLIHRVKGLRHVAPTAYVHHGAQVCKDLVADDYAFVGPGCILAPAVSIGRYTMLASQVAIRGDDHRWDQVGVPMQFTGRPAQSGTVLEDDVWVGFRVTIIRGVRIGRGSVVAAQAVVTSDVSPYTIVGGVPAREIGKRFQNGSDRLLHDDALNGPLMWPRFVGPLQAPQNGAER
jgi:acetyltransferase-like isoleucine patch superfamily enzyme